MYLTGTARVTALRKDIREDLRRAAEGPGRGGDFHVPFWTAAKAHARNLGDLPTMVDDLVARNPRRARLYPLLEDGFLTYWNERRRWINEPFEVLHDSVRARYAVESLSCSVKVENLFSVRMADGAFRLIYPYFSEDPILRDEAARLGLWVMGRAIRNFDPRGFRILDVLRATSFRAEEHPFRGDEENLFLDKYAALLREWQRLRREYD